MKLICLIFLSTILASALSVPSKKSSNLQKSSPRLKQDDTAAPAPEAAAQAQPAPQVESPEPAPALGAPAPETPQLNAVAVAVNYARALKNQAWDYQETCPSKKKTYSQMTKAPGNLVIPKNKALGIKKFSLPPSKLVGDILSNFLLNPFKEEIQSSYQSFLKSSSLINVPEIKAGFGENKWKIEGNLDKLSEFMYSTYNVDGKDGLSEQEFAFMAIDNVFSYKPNQDCKNCLTKIRAEIGLFFDFLDCDSNAYVQAKDLFTVFKKMKGSDDLTTTNVNDWLLKEDYRGIGRLGRAEFTEAVLKSLYEQNYL